MPTTKNIPVQYELIGYVLFSGDKRSGHYRVICRNHDDQWFLYNDEDTRELNEKARANHSYKCEVLLLLYAEKNYYNNGCHETLYESEGCDGAI